MTEVVPYQPDDGKIAVQGLFLEGESLYKMMEEMANAPKEEYGKRSPGERCMFEIQRQSMAERTAGPDA